MMKQVILWFVVIILFIGSGLFTYRQGILSGRLALGKEVNAHIKEICVKELPISGQNLMDAFNTYRKNHNIPEMKINSDACNNIAQRFEDITNPANTHTAHPGFDNFSNNLFKLGYKSALELMATGNTTEEIINAWDGSPSHHQGLVDKTFTQGCVYAAPFEGSTVGIIVMVK